MRTYTEDQLDEKGFLVIATSTAHRLKGEAFGLEHSLSYVVDSVDGLSSEDVLNMTRIQYYMAEIFDKLMKRQKKLREEGKE